MWCCLSESLITIKFSFDLSKNFTMWLCECMSCRQLSACESHLSFRISFPGHVLKPTLLMNSCWLLC